MLRELSWRRDTGYGRRRRDGSEIVIVAYVLALYKPQM